MTQQPTPLARVLSVLLVSMALVGAGCSEPLVEYTASPATIPDAAHSPHGYVHGNTTEVPLSYPVGFGSLSRDIQVNTWVSGYSKTTDENETAVFVLYSSPNVEVENRSLNPLRQLSNRELVGFVIERVADLRGLGGVENVSDLRELGVRNVTVLGTPTQVVSYTGLADIDDQRVTVILNIAVVEHGDDVVVALGIHEETLDERATHAALVEAISHDG